MSEYPYEDKIHSDDRVNYKTVYSADGIKMGKVEAAFSDSFIVKVEKEENNMEINMRFLGLKFQVLQMTELPLS